MNLKLYFISGLIGLTSLWNIEIPKRAFRFYERGDIEKTVEALEKSVAKDSLNPAAYYLYAKLYTDTAFQHYSTDTAYLYTKRAYNQLQFVTDLKDIEDLNEFSVDSTRLEEQKDKIDSLKFLEVRAIHTIPGYNSFMVTHQDALQIPEAVRLRNHIAFEQATQVNTWQHYEKFMVAYPQSDDFSEAEKRYKKLLYEERTADGTLESLSGFLEEFPNTPYRQSIEVDIFNYLTAINTLASFVDFLQTYPNQKLARKLYDRAYHIYTSKYPEGDFFNDFDFGVPTDSLKHARSLEKEAWLPKLEDGQFTFMNLNGEERLKTPFNQLDVTCLCEPQFQDFVVGSANGKSQLLGRNGSLIYEGIFDKAVDAGFGFIVVSNVEGDRLIHKSGEVIITEPKEEISLIDNRFIKTKKRGFYGLESIHGFPYLENEYISIDTFNTFIVLEKEEGLEAVKPEQLIPGLQGTPHLFKAQFEEFEALPNGRIWAMKNDEEAILDEEFNLIIPFGKHEIYERAYGWRLESEKGIRLIHDRYSDMISNTSFNEVLENDRWLILKKDSAWTLLDQVGTLAPETTYDSLAFWGENMVMLFKGDNSFAQFKNGKKLRMEPGWEPSLLVPQIYVTTGEKAENDFFMLTDKKKKRKIYNDNGREILNSTFQEVAALGPNTLRLQKRNAALADSTGYYVLNFVYDGIGSNNKGYVSILDKGKVGVINTSKNIKIPPEYDRLLEPYSDTVMVASDGKYKGFISTSNTPLTTYEFDEVVYFNDTIALTRIEDEWLIYNIAADKALYEGILDYTLLERLESSYTLKIATEKGFGIFSLERGELVDPTYTNVKVLGTPDKPIYFAVKLIEEADIYIVIYFDGKGNKLLTQSFRKDEYLRIACPKN